VGAGIQPRHWLGQVDGHPSHRVDDVPEALETQADNVRDSDAKIRFDYTGSRLHASSGLVKLGEIVRRVNAVLAVPGDADPQVTRDGDQAHFGQNWGQGGEDHGITAPQNAAFFWRAVDADNQQR